MQNTLRSVISPVQLAAGDAVAGTIFYKQIMSYGTWINPNWWWDEELTMELDEELADKMIENFDNKVYGKRISVPLNHTGDVTANTGEVIKLVKESDGLYAYLDIKRPEVVADINNNLIFEVSMGFDWDFVSQKDGKHYGPTLIHVALVTDPYLNDMKDFTERELSKRFDAYASTVSFSQDIMGKEQHSIIMMSKSKVEEIKHMKFAKIKNDKEFDVTVTYKDGDEDKEVVIKAGEEVEVPTDVETEVTKQVTDAVAPAADDDHEGETEEEKKAREAEEAAAAGGDDGETEEEKAAREAEEAKTHEASENTALAKALKENAELKAKATYDELLSKGKIVPGQKALFMSLATSSTVKLGKDFTGIKLSKEEKENTSIVTLLSAILEAGPTHLNYKEKGTTTEGDEAKVELSEEQEAKLTKMGVNIATFKKQLAKGTITLEEEK